MKVKLKIFISIYFILVSCQENIDENNLKKDVSENSGEPFEFYLKDDSSIIELTYNIEPDSVELEFQSEYKSNLDIFINGYISNFSVDNLGRVYIVASIPGNIGVYVFDSEGNYIKTLGNYGRGPGEFEAIGSIDIFENELILFDPILQRITVYSIQNFEIKEELSVDLSAAFEFEDIPSIAKGKKIVKLKNGKMILEVGSTSLSEERDGKQNYYFLVENDGTIKQNKLLEVNRHKRYFLPERVGWAIPITKPFNRSSLVSITRSGSFFTAWTEDFLLKKYDENGQLLKSIYYNHAKSNFSLNQINIASHERRMLEGEKIPETWPVLHTMELDDEGRIWVASITDSDSTFKWHIVNQKGKLLARFTKDGIRSERKVITKPLIKIKNGFFYEHETNYQDGIDRVVKYKIKFAE